MDQVRFGLALRALRRRRAWTQQQARRSSAALSRSAVQRIERGGLDDFTGRTVRRDERARRGIDRAAPRARPAPAPPPRSSSGRRCWRRPPGPGRGPPGATPTARGAGTPPASLPRRRAEHVVVDAVAHVGDRRRWQVEPRGERGEERRVGLLDARLSLDATRSSATPRSSNSRSAARRLVARHADPEPGVAQGPQRRDGIGVQVVGDEQLREARLDPSPALGAEVRVGPQQPERDPVVLAARDRPAQHAEEGERRHAEPVRPPDQPGSPRRASRRRRRRRPGRPAPAVSASGPASSCRPSGHRAASGALRPVRLSICSTPRR